ncbi:MAG: L-2-amino-thiazoline-4-carboxylic acid hydrolase [Bradymonadia bacterium]
MNVERAVVRALVAELGLMKTVLTLLRLGWSKLTYHPFAHLEQACNADESLARAHVRDALILYRSIEPLDRGNPLMTFERVMSQGAQAFLRDAIGVVDVERYQSESTEARRAWVKGLLTRFPNAEADVLETSDRRVKFSVSRCRYVELAQVAGYPMVAKAFCVGDRAFFESQPAGISFQREKSIASGADHCPFELVMIDETSDPRN